MADAVASRRILTNEIVAAIEAGAGEWRMLWHHDGSSIARPVNILSKKDYRGIAVHARGYASGLWGTYRQWAARGAQVRKSEKATSIVFWKQIRGAVEGEDETAAGTDDEDDRPRFVARGYAVFNKAQVEGFGEPEAPRLPHLDRARPRDGRLCKKELSCHRLLLRASGVLARGDAPIDEESDGRHDM